MTSAPFEPGSGAGGDIDLPSTDLGVAGPAENTGTEGDPLNPPGYPDQVDPAEGPVSGR